MGAQAQGDLTGSSSEKCSPLWPILHGLDAGHPVRRVHNPAVVPSYICQTLLARSGVMTT